MIPLVEICPAPHTAADVVDRVATLMTEAGMVPVRLTREIDGFIANRLQAALLWEAFRLLEEGIATTEDIDKTISAGLGRRWTFMGPFETIDLNAPKGLADYAARLAPGFFEFVKQSEPARPWSDEVVTRAHDECRRPGGRIGSPRPTRVAGPATHGPGRAPRDRRNPTTVADRRTATRSRRETSAILPAREENGAGPRHVV